MPQQPRHPIQPPLMQDLQGSTQRKASKDEVRKLTNRALDAIAELAELNEVSRLQLIGRTTWTLLREFDAR